MDVTSKAMLARRHRFEVIIYTQTHKIVGVVHTMPASRLVDFMNSKAADLFIVVTDAEVYKLPDDQLIQTADYFAINKDAIMMVFPKVPGSPSKPGEQSQDTQA
jgi:ABC-type molybdate transport system substrate-binding protein